MSTADYDAVVVGAGHNGLICAAYLARAGLRTAVLEARPTPGGCASTVDALGARINICNCDHLLVRSLPLEEELDLPAHGLRYLDVNPSQSNLFWDDHPPWYLWRDVEQTIDGLRRSYPSEVDGYRRFVRAARPVAELIIELAQTTLSRRSLTNLLSNRAVAAAKLFRWSRLSASGLLRNFFNHEAMVLPALATGPIVWGLDGSTPGTGLGALGYVLRHLVGVARPAGGSGALIDAVERSFRGSGGELRCDTRVDAIVVGTGGTLKGVRVVGDSGGVMIEARRVVVACDPRVVRLEGSGVPHNFAGTWAAPAPDGYESKIDAVVSDPPVYRRTPEGEDASQSLTPTTMILPSLSSLSRNLADSAKGRVGDDPVFFANVPSALDASMRPPGGGHVFSLEVLYTPFALTGGWEHSDEPDRWLRRFGEHVQPGFAEGIVRWRTMTPPDYEEQFYLPRGYAASFTGSPLSALLGKPRHLTRYRTPIKGLFLTGGVTYPGAGVWGASGRNTAGVLLEQA